ncbi:AAA family ATPase [Micromonospora lupini]|uniref:AAA family ATPase n=1 Tax=Micromonospora lupini TaxID=285679 RepID=UPI00224CC0B7|nr:AAA family ATPase [Micromonospora lupini]MCX5070878.1 AAA family ATPase [Micromonospora lupini]
MSDRDYDLEVCGDLAEDLYFNPNHPDADAWRAALGGLTASSAPVLYVTVGLPGSGKTTWARATGRTRLNRDDLRDQMHGVRDYTPEHEREVTIAQHAAVAALLRAGITVVTDDTNLRDESMALWEELAQRCGARLVVVDDFLTVPVADCIRRQAARPLRERVPAHRIQAMASEYAATQNTKRLTNHVTAEAPRIADEARRYWPA